jgi:hypothetical protein
VEPFACVEGADDSLAGGGDEGGTLLELGKSGADDLELGEELARPAPFVVLVHAARKQTIEHVAARTRMR